MIFIALFALLIASLALAGFCAGAETGMLSLNRMRITHLAREGSKAAKILSAAISDLPRTTTTLLIGNNLAAVLFSSASAAFAERAFPGSAIAQTAWSIAAAFTVLYLSEFLPKRLCASRPLQRMLRLAPFWRILALVLSPLGAAVSRMSTFFVGRTAQRERMTANSLLRILQDRKDGVRITDFESALISRILVLRKKAHAVTPESLLSALDDEN